MLQLQRILQFPNKNFIWWHRASSEAFIWSKQKRWSKFDSTSSGEKLLSFTLPFSSSSWLTTNIMKETQ
jgi:hypothetical protein